MSQWGKNEMDFERGNETDSGRLRETQGAGYMVSLNRCKKRKQNELIFVKGKLTWVFTLNFGI